MIYNNDIALWKHYRKSLLAEKDTRIIMISDDGDIIDGKEVTARCRDREAAITLLTRAGFTPVDKGYRA